MLETQYRMHEDIMYFPSQQFYKGRLQASPEVRHRNILEYDTPIEWFDTALCEFSEGLCQRNIRAHQQTREAELLVKQLQEYT